MTDEHEPEQVPSDEELDLEGPNEGAAGETFEGLVDAGGNRQDRASRSAGAEFKLDLWPPSIGPGSWQLIARSLARPNRHRPASLLAGWLPQGMISNGPLKDTIRRVVP